MLLVFLAVGLGFFSPVLADEVPVPTLDRVKKEATTYLNGSYSTYELTEVTDTVTAPEGAITVKIGDKAYYYVPGESDNRTVLSLLSSTGSVAMIETTSNKALYSTPDGKYYTYDTNKLKGSGYTLSEIAASDPSNLPGNAITLYDKKEVIKYYDPTTGAEVAEADRLPDVQYKEVTTIETTPKYYTVTLKQTEYGSSTGDMTLTFGWEKNVDTGKYEFKENPASPQGQTITYKYTEADFTGGTVSNVLDKGTFTDVGSSSAHYQIEGGAGLNNPAGTITLNAVNNGEITFNDTVNGQQDYTLSLTGDSSSKIILNNDIINANISLDSTNLYLGREDVLNNSSSLSLNSGSIYLNNNSIGTMHIPTLNLNGNTHLSVDVDLASETMDRITANIYNITNDATLNVSNLTLISTTEKENVKILFADEPLANNVKYTGGSPVSYKGTNTIYSPIYKYEVKYATNPEDKLGYFFFNRATSGSGANGNISDAYNPSVLAPVVATQAGAYTTQLQTFNYAFQHSDNFMNIPYLERLAIKNSGRYVLSPTADATDVGTFSPLLTKEEDPGFWVKPYALFEKIPLKNGPKVSNINYCTLVGYDSPLTSVKNGWERVLTGYVGYNGASQRYSGVDAYQNGGLLGATLTLYKGNFFNATTLSAGASVGDATTMYGSEESWKIIL